MADFSSQVSSKLGDKDILLTNGTNERVYGIKISEALLTVCQPLMEEIGNRGVDEARRAIGLGVIAWNLAGISDLGEEALKASLEGVKELIGHLDEESMMAFCGIILGLATRKRELFPDFDCLIMHYEVLENNGQLRVNVASVPYSDSKATEWRNELQRQQAAGRL